jgi:hypothetical protein
MKSRIVPISEILAHPTKSLAAKDYVETHYIYGSGQPGCLYDMCGVARTLAEAVDSMAEAMNASHRWKRQLRLAGVNSLHNGTRCEITVCHCATPWVHDETQKPEDWPEYEVRT